MRSTCYSSFVIFQCLIFLCANQIFGCDGITLNELPDEAMKYLIAEIEADIFKHRPKPPSDLPEHIKTTCVLIVPDVMKKYKIDSNEKPGLLSNCEILYEQRFNNPAI